MNHRKTLLVTALLVAGATFAVGSFAQTATAVAPAPQAAAPGAELSAVDQPAGRQDQVRDQDDQDAGVQGRLRQEGSRTHHRVRNENEFEDGFVPGAVNVPRGLIEFRIWKLAGFPDKTDMAKKMTLYCASGGRCALATKTLMELGFTNVTSVDMMFADWVKAGYPVEKPKK